jgi:hypothetical protein
MITTNRVDSSIRHTAYAQLPRGGDHAVGTLTGPKQELVRSPTTAHPYLSALRALRGESIDRTRAQQEADLMRAPGVDGILVSKLLGDLGWRSSDYCGFQHLGERVSNEMLGADPWSWHRELLASSLSGEFKAVLAADLLFLSADERIHKEVEVFLPRSVTLVAQGRGLSRRRISEAMAMFEQAAVEDPSSGPVLRHAGDAAYRRGDGVLANEWFHMSLHTNNSESFDLKKNFGDESWQVPEPCLVDYYGSDYMKVGHYFVVTKRRAPISRHVPQGMRAWVRKVLPPSWWAALRTTVYVFLDFPARLTGSRFDRSPYHRGANLLALSREMKALSQT